MLKFLKEKSNRAFNGDALNCIILVALWFLLSPWAAQANRICSSKDHKRLPVLLRDGDIFLVCDLYFAVTQASR